MVAQLLKPTISLSTKSMTSCFAMAVGLSVQRLGLSAYRVNRDPSLFGDPLNGVTLRQHKENVGLLLGQPKSPGEQIGGGTTQSSHTTAVFG